MSGATDPLGIEYDEQQAARILGVSPRTLRTWRKGGALSYYSLPGGRVRYSLQQLSDFMQSRRVAAGNCRTFPHSAAQR